ncbi:MAG: 50S ribosomal protein L23 [Clostridia bacterium]|nr:50S ribosomal protein L23 [Clostridia bacterium]
MEISNIIIKPLLSEKAYSDIKNKKYWFVVDKNATKEQIKLAVEQMFSVQVESVNTSITAKKPKKRQGRVNGYTSSIKKAVVTLKKDSKPIAFFESLS